MKNFFAFNLTGKKIFPIWVLFYILVIIPYAFLSFKMSNFEPGSTSSYYALGSIFALIFIAYLLMFYIIKLLIEGVAFKDISIIFSGEFKVFAGKLLLGCFLSVITLGIYLPWFVKKIYSYFVEESSYNSNSLQFKGTGRKLFVIILLTLIIPVFLLAFVLGILSSNGTIPANSIPIILSFTYLIILPPYLYCVYKWMVNFDYKGYNISWETKFWNSIGKIFLEIFLSIITLGIYFPMALIKLYEYFVSKTVAKSDEIKKGFGFDKDNLKDFLFFWGQILLTIITLGIYYPWLICNVGKRLINKTYIKE